MHRALLATLAALASTACLGASAVSASVTVKTCKPVVNPYASTRYEGVDLNRITASGVTCTTARGVARGAHYKALGITPPENGIRHFTWNGWKVTGDLRPSRDRYTATKNGHTVRWRF
jgi:hypothetical protein